MAKHVILWFVLIGALAGSLITAETDDAKATDPKQSDTPISTDSARTVAIKQALAKPLGLTFDNKPLDEALAQLANELGIPIVLDPKELEAGGIVANTPVRFNVAGVTAKSALNLMLRPLDLDYTIRDEVLWISTAEAVATVQDVQVYEVTDLIDQEVDFDSLIALITSIVEPHAWDEVGGPGAIAPYSAGDGKALAVLATCRVHDEIAALFTLLRAVHQDRDPTRERIPARLPLPRAAAPGSPGAPTSQARPLAGNQQFAFELYRELRPADEGSLFFSPYSVSEALAMVYAGAAGKTAEEMALALHFPPSADELGPALAAVRDQLTAENKTPGIKLVAANRLWAKNDYPLLDSFVNEALVHYGAPIGRVDFEQPHEACKIINDWVSQQTSDKIKDLVNPRAIDPKLTRLIVTSAIYFNGKWAHPFPEDSGATMPFVSGARKIDVPEMTHQERCRYASIDGTQIVEKTYAGGHLAMLVLLPSPVDHALANLEKSLSADKLQAWESRLSWRNVEIHLPRFKLVSNFQLSSALQSLGMRSAFVYLTQGAADFSRMTQEKGFFISDVIHQATVDVHESGTEAAAATAIVGFGSGIAPRGVVFRADHPFVFLIHDRRSGAILFLGRYTGPEAPMP